LSGACADDQPKEENDMKPMFPPENGRSQENEKKTNEISVAALDRATHDIANQLSIIYLCCCELRYSLAEKLLAHQLNELGRIETAAQESARLVEKLKTSLRDHDRTPQKPASILTRVEATDSFYPIISYPALRR
jgi:hypothetical protein